jgi:hypothetical protein
MRGKKRETEETTEEVKGPTAVEYLMTYGWAVLIILIVAGVLAYYGIFAPIAKGADCSIPQEMMARQINLTGSQVNTSVSCVRYTDPSDTCDCKIYNYINGWKITVSQSDWQWLGR